MPDNTSHTGERAGGKHGLVSPLVIVVSGPSGVGKDAVLSRIRTRSSDNNQTDLVSFAVPVTLTTREPRDGEIDGVDYIFVSDDEFNRKLEAGELIEHAEVYGHSYGVPRSQLRQALSGGKDVIMRVDVQGAATLKQQMSEALFVLLVPDDSRKLEKRLRERGMDNISLRQRLNMVELELAQKDQFDHVVVNVEGDLDGTVDRLLAIIEEERVRPDRRAVRV